MHLEPIAPADLSTDQRPLNDSMQAGVAKHLHGFIAKCEDGALIGPFPAMLHFPQFGTAAWSIFTALSENSTLPKTAHEVEILVTGARLNSRYNCTRTNASRSSPV